MSSINNKLLPKINQNKKQKLSALSLEKRKMKRRLVTSGEVVITSDMISDKLVTSCVDRIASVLPKVRPKPNPPSCSNGNNNGNRRHSNQPYDVPIPYYPLKKNILWMSMKEQDASSTMSLSEEIMNFADYVSVGSY